MRARVERLDAGDLVTLWAEEPATPFHIGLAGLLEPGRLVDERGRLRLQELRTAVDARLARVPELRRRIRWTGFGEGRPAVVDDHGFAIARHVTAVDLGGVDEPAFWSWCANHALRPLDREHPRWRVTFATGLAGGQVGVLVVLHHALADGMAGAALAERLLDAAPDAVAVPRPWRAAPPPGPLVLAVDAVAGRLAAIGAALRHLHDAPRTIRLAGRDAAATRAALPRPPRPPPWATRSGPAAGWPSSAAPSPRLSGRGGPTAPPSTMYCWPRSPVACTACSPVVASRSRGWSCGSRSRWAPTAAPATPAAPPLWSWRYPSAR